MRFPLRLAAMLLVLTALPAATITDQRGGTTIQMTLADLPGHPSFQSFLREDAAAIADDYAVEGARRVDVVERITQSDARFASVLRRIEADIGGKEPNIYVEASVWDDSAADFVRLDALFDAGTSRDEALIVISRHLRETIRKRVWNGKINPAYLPLVEQATNPDPAVMANFTLENGGIAFHYSPYEIAPYAVGPVSILVPKSLFGTWLNGTGRAAIR